MPSPFGHALAGLATAWAIEPAPPDNSPVWAPDRLAITCAALAAAPDLDLFVRGAHRTATHSVAAVVVTTIIAAGVTGWVTGRIRWRVALVCGAAYASHLLLDWMGADPNLPSGIQLLWPNHTWFISPFPIFPGTERRHILTLAAIRTNLTAFVVESVVLGSMVGALGWWRARRRCRSRVPTSGQGAQPRPSGEAADTDGTSDRQGRRAAR